MVIIFAKKGKILVKQNEFLDKKISELDDDLKILKKKNYDTASVVILMTFGIIPAIIFAHIFAFPSGVALLAIWDFVAYMNGYAVKKRRGQKIRLLEKKRKHLKKVKENGVKSTKKLNIKRLERIRELTKEHDNYMEKNEVNSAISHASLIVSLISSMLLAGTGFAAIGVAGGLLSSLVASDNLIKNSEEIKKLEARIDNLKNDIELGSIYRYKPENTVADETDKTLNKGETVRAITYSPIQEKQVDQYLTSLENSKTNDYAKEKVKK